MNLLYGCSGKKAQEAQERLEKAVQRRFGSSGHNLIPASPNLFLSVLDDGGCGVTSLVTPNLSAALIGLVYGKTNPDYNEIFANMAAEAKAALTTCHGEYAIVVADLQAQKVMLATDAGGLRNIYFSEVDETIWFSTHLATLAQALGNETAVDRGHEDFLLSYGFVPFGQTLYQGINEVPTGAVLTIDRTGRTHQEPIVRQDPWSGTYSQVDIGSLPEDHALEVMENAFMDAMAEVAHPSPTAAVLLGGVDSALVAAALQRLGKQVTTYSFFYEEASLNQTHTDTLANHLGIKHVWVPITSDIISDGLKHFSDRFNRPTNWPNYLIQTEYLCKRIREDGHEVCYSGDGCDGIFLGYPRTHTVAKFLDNNLGIPKPLFKFMERLLSAERLERSLGRPFRVAMNLLRNLALRPPSRGFIPFRVLDDLTLKHLRADPPPTQYHTVEELLSRLSASTKGLSADRRAYHGKGIVGVNKTKISGAADSAGLPILSPYLHPGLGLFARSLPGALLRPADKPEYKKLGKYLLLAMAEKSSLLPSEVIHQPKISAVEGPIDEWYFNELSGQLYQSLQGLPFALNEPFARSLLRPKRSEALYSKYVSSDKLTTHEVSLLATYASFAIPSQE